MYLDEYIAAAGIAGDPDAPLFHTAAAKTGTLTGKALWFLRHGQHSKLTGPSQDDLGFRLAQFPSLHQLNRYTSPDHRSRPL